MTGPLRGLLAAEWRTQWRYRIPAVLAGLAAVWTAAAVAAPAAAPYLLFVEVMTVGTVIAGALAVLEQGSGAAAALRVSPAHPAQRVAARLAPLTALTAACAVPVLLVGGVGTRLPAAVAAVGLAGLLLAAIATAVAARTDSLLGFLTRLPWPLIPLLGPPLAVGIGLLDAPAWYAIPTTAVVGLARGEAPYPAWLLLAYLAAWTAAALWTAARTIGAPERAAPTRRRSGRELTGPLVFPRADLRSITRDAVLMPVVASPLLLGLAARFGYPPLESFLATRHGIDLAGHRPVIALLVVVMHVPVIAGLTGALLVLDDLDGDVLQVIRVSPLGVPGYLTYRLGLVTAAAAAGLAIAAPLSGLVPATAWPAVLLAVPLAPLFTLAVLAVAGSRVGGVTAGKVLGIPAYLPLVAWWLTGPAGWLLAPLPGFWILRAFTEPDPAWLAAGAACTTGWLLLLTRLTYTRLR